MNNSFDSLYAKAVKAGFFRKNDVGTTRAIGTVPCSLSDVVNKHHPDIKPNSFRPYYGT